MSTFARTLIALTNGRLHNPWGTLTSAEAPEKNRICSPPTPTPLCGPHNYCSTTTSLQPAKHRNTLCTGRGRHHAVHRRVRKQGAHATPTRKESGDEEDTARLRGGQRAPPRRAPRRSSSTVAGRAHPRCRRPQPEKLCPAAPSAHSRRLRASGRPPRHMLPMPPLLLRKPTGRTPGCRRAG